MALTYLDRLLSFRVSCLLDNSDEFIAFISLIRIHSRIYLKQRLYPRGCRYSRLQFKHFQKSIDYKKNEHERRSDIVTVEMLKMTSTKMIKQFKICK